MDCILPGSSVHGILQARMLEWVIISFFVPQSVSKWEEEINAISKHLCGEKILFYDLQLGKGIKRQGKMKILT